MRWRNSLQKIFCYDKVAIDRVLGTVWIRQSSCGVVDGTGGCLEKKDACGGGGYGVIFELRRVRAEVRVWRRVFFFAVEGRTVAAREVK